MPKTKAYIAGDALTPDLMNILLQDGQILQAKGQGTSDLMSQKTVTDELNNLESTKVARAQIVQSTGASATNLMSQNAVTTKCVTLDSAQTITGEKTFTGTVRIESSSGGKLNFGDSDYVYLHEYEDNKLEIKASAFKLVGTSWDDSSSKIPAYMISITQNVNLGNATTLQGALDYIANVFAGTQNVTKLSATTVNVTNVSATGQIRGNNVYSESTISALTYNAR